jgi:hypothetical protein
MLLWSWLRFSDELSKLPASLKFVYWTMPVSQLNSGRLAGIVSSQLDVAEAVEGELRLPVDNSVFLGGVCVDSTWQTLGFGYRGCRHG